MLTGLLTIDYPLIKKEAEFDQFGLKSGSFLKQDTKLAFFIEKPVSPPQSAQQEYSLEEPSKEKPEHVPVSSARKKTIKIATKAVGTARLA